MKESTQRKHPHWRRTGSRVAAIMLFIALTRLQSSVSLYGQSTDVVAKDKSPHKVSFVEVQPGVRLEVLDWGGIGPPMVLLAGLGDSAHVFDSFAAKLTPHYHVYGLTRRGAGISDSPQPVWQNYTADRLGDDVLKVLETLNLDQAVLVGHSIAGEELSSIGSRHPERVRALVYLDAGGEAAMYVQSVYSNLIDWNDMRNKVDAINFYGPVQYQRLLIQQMINTEIPLYVKGLKERLQLLADLPDAQPLPQETLGSHSFQVAWAILHGEQRFTEIHCPALVIYSVPRPPHVSAGGDSKSEEASYKLTMSGIDSEAQAFEAQHFPAKIVRIAGADHYMYRSNEGDVLREIFMFMHDLPTTH
jgi:non-heme chloroperoxidase